VPSSLFYQEESTGLCLSLLEHPMAYVVDTFDDFEKCCQVSWKKEACLEQSPTMSPTTYPTWSPSSSFPTLTTLCPEAYDSSGSRRYKKGSEVAVNHVAYRCKPAPHSAYCNKAEFQPPQKDPGSPVTATETKSNIPVSNIGGGQQLWQDAWERLRQCNYAPSTSPSTRPTTAAPSYPNCRTRWHPGERFDMRICTNSPSYPSSWNDPIMLLTYFTDTAEECCEKFYSGKKCRIRVGC